jgi:DNA polymerase-1
LSKPIEYDVETTGLQPWSGSQHAFLYCFYDGVDAVALRYSPDDKRNHEEIQRWFNKGKDVGIRAWNSKFDRAFGEAAGFDLPGDGKWHDGMIVAHAVDERRSVALKAVASSLFGEEAADQQKKVKGFLAEERRRRKKAAEESGGELVEPNYSDVPMDIMEPYALEDVILTRKVSDHYDVLLRNEPDLNRVIDFERDVMDALYAVEKRGLPARQDFYQKLEVEVIENLEQQQERIMELADDPDFNPNSSPQIIEMLKHRKADMSYMSQKNGKISADAENLRAVDDELAQAILEFRSEFKVLSTYVRPMVNRSYVTAMRSYKEPFISALDGRIHANYRQVGARTGRMSCSDPNIQNQPRDDLRLRYNICADDGVLVTCDLSNIEMVLFAAYAGEGRLLNAVRNGEDLHELTARMLGFRDRRRPGGVYETARQQGKTYNFSRVYGGGLRTIRRSFRCSLEEAKVLKKRFDDAYPEVKRLNARIEAGIAQRGYLQDHMISGRRFHVNYDEAYKGTNYLVQGTAASVLKYALVQLHKDGVPVVGLIHDEVVAHVDKKDAKEVQHLIIQRLTEHEGLNEKVPLRADGDIVKHWSDAKPLLDRDTGQKYLFTPEWAGGEKRYLEAA